MISFDTVIKADRCLLEIRPTLPDGTRGGLGGGIELDPEPETERMCSPNERFFFNV